MARSPIEKEGVVEETESGENGIIEEGILVTPESHPEAFEPGDPQEALKAFVQEYGLPEGSQLRHVIQHVIDQTGHNVSLAMLMQIAWMCGATLQVEITENEEVEPTPI